MTRRRLATLVMALQLTGCTSFRAERPMETLPAQAAPRDKYQVWSGGRAQLLVALRVTPESLSGVPSWKAPDCDSCRVAFARRDVDSVRVRGYDGNKTLVFALIMTPIVWVLYAFRGMSDPNY